MEYINELCRIIAGINEKKIEEMAESILESDTIYVIGNGGSMATAQHFSQDLLKCCGLRAIALTNISEITAFANDLEYRKCFSSLETLCRDKDCIFCITTSGESENLIYILERFFDSGTKILSLVGRDNSTIERLSDISIVLSTDKIWQA